MGEISQKLALVRSIRFRKARALLFFLLHSPEIDHRSEKIADVFWRDYTHEKAMASLRQTIRQVRVLLAGFPAINLETHRGHLGCAAMTKRRLGPKLRGSWRAALGR